MKNRKVKFGTLAIVILLGISLQSCKKGENDPFLSLKTRDSRITGSWELISMERNSQSSETYNGTTTSYSNSATLKDGVITYIYGTDVNTYLYSEKLSILKGGEYTNEVTLTLLDQTESDTDSESGRWYWMDNKKKKTGISIDGSEWVVDRLTDKELVLKNQYENSDSSTNGYSYSSSTSITKTYKKNK